MAFFSTFGYDPFREMRRLQSEMDRLFSNMASFQEVPRLQDSGAQPQGAGAGAGAAGSGGAAAAAAGGAGSGAGSGAMTVSGGSTMPSFWPSVDVKESDKAITVHAELPGLRKEDINVQVDHGVLTISGQRTQEKKEENEKWRRVERSYGSFSRSFRLPEGVKEDEIQASCKDGVLEVVVPKPVQPPKTPKKITIA